MRRYLLPFFPAKFDEFYVDEKLLKLISRYQKKAYKKPLKNALIHNITQQ